MDLGREVLEALEAMAFPKEEAVGETKESGVTEIFGKKEGFLREGRV